MPPCRRGTYADVTGLPACRNCGAGTYQDATGATSGPESAPVKKVVEVIEFEIPVGFVASIDDVPS